MMDWFDGSNVTLMMMCLMMAVFWATVIWVAIAVGRASHASGTSLDHSRRSTSTHPEDGFTEEEIRRLREPVAGGRDR